MVLVRKKDGSWRFCVDYRKLSNIYTKDVYPFPRIDDALIKLEGFIFYSIIDMKTGYWQIDARLEDRKKTAFLSYCLLFNFKMPFGLSKAPSEFQ